ncbi:MAG: TlpA family protein disulfide reductase [Balneolia bacterium]|nr:TlpA family protein disulfide reductase [Balneolia bacterium]
MPKYLLISVFIVLLIIPVYLLTSGPSEPAGGFPSIMMRDITDPSTAGDELKPAPDFTLTDMEGNPFTLSEQRGKIVVLNIWATWCPPCREEIPDFMELQAEFQADDVLFLGVSIDQEGWEIVEPFVNEMQINYPQVVDDGTVVDRFGPIMGVPMTFLINREGYVEGYAPGMLHKERLQPILESIIQRS